MPDIAIDAPRNGRRNLVRAVGATATTALLATLPGTAAFAQRSWPDRPVRVVSPFPPGGLADSTARLITERLTAHLGQPFLVDNKPGASATIGTENVARADPDGHTFLMSFSANITITPHMQAVRYDALKDLRPVSKLTGYYGIVAVHGDAPYRDYRDLVQAARRSPGKLTYGSNGVGTTSYLIAAILHGQTGIDLVHVPYKGSAEFLNDLLAKRIDVIYDSIALPQVQAGRLKALAALTPERHPALPDVPTLAELGYEMLNRNWFAVFAPKGTPDAIVTKLSTTLSGIIQEPEVRARLVTLSQYPEFLGPADFQERVAADSAFFKDFIARNGLNQPR